MGLLDINLNEIPDQRLLEPGEHEFRIDKAEMKTSKAGDDMIAIMLVSLDDAIADSVFEYLTLPAMGDDEQKTRRKLLKVKNCVRAFGLGDDWKNLETWIGATGYAITAIQSTPEFGDKATIQKYVVPAE